jgi:hypothetical protein
MSQDSSLAATFPLHTLQGFFVQAALGCFPSLTNQVGGRISQRCTALREVLHAFIGLGLGAPASLRACPRRNHHANADADANTEQKTPQYVSIHCSFAPFESHPQSGASQQVYMTARGMLLRLL